MKKNKNKKNPKHRRIAHFFMLFLLVAGVLVACYPFYVDGLNQFLDQRTMRGFQQELAKKNDDLLENITYKNQRLVTDGLSPGADPFNVSDNEPQTTAYYQKHWLGSVVIPKIAVDIPLFGETSDALLQRGACVLPGTSYPAGDGEIHSVISAHSGLPERKLFTNLGKLVSGDTFIVTILGEKRAYEVNDIRVVEPEDTSSLSFIEGQETVTLLTCTPYMVNSHRLLVSGHRVPYSQTIDDAISQSQKKQFWYLTALLAGALLFLLTVMILLVKIFRKPVPLKERKVKKRR